MSSIDWVAHYASKTGLVIRLKDLQKLRISERSFVELVTRHVPYGSNILECGAGLARTSFILAESGFHVTAMDIDPRLTMQGRHNAVTLGLDVDFYQCDFFDVRSVVKPEYFKAIIHGGILEHFIPWDIIRILRLQLNVVSKVIFSVPIKSEYNRNYFNDSHYRNLWQPAFWCKEILAEFKIYEACINCQRSENLQVVLVR